MLFLCCLVLPASFYNISVAILLSFFSVKSFHDPSLLIFHAREVGSLLRGFIWQWNKKKFQSNAKNIELNEGVFLRWYRLCLYNGIHSRSEVINMNIRSRTLPVAVYLGICLAKLKSLHWEFCTWSLLLTAKGSSSMSWSHSFNCELNGAKFLTKWCSRYCGKGCTCAECIRDRSLLALFKYMVWALVIVFSCT